MATAISLYCLSESFKRAGMMEPVGSDGATCGSCFMFHAFILVLKRVFWDDFIQEENDNLFRSYVFAITRKVGKG